jgi:hypothetical protein
MLVRFRQGTHMGRFGSRECLGVNNYAAFNGAPSRASVAFACRDFRFRWRSAKL